MEIEVYDKLVRDKIPLIIKATSDVPIWHCISNNEEILLYLAKKVREETEEFLQSYNISELVDLIEVLTILVSRLGYDSKEITFERNNKNQKNGCFEQMIVLDKVIRSTDMSKFDNKTDCDVYVPFETHNDELFLVELLEMCEAYLEPLKYGITKEDLSEFIENEKAGMTLLDFLVSRRYIANDNCFLELTEKYMIRNNCVKISFHDVCYADIEHFFSEHSISEIRNGGTKCYTQQVGRITNEGIFIDDAK